MEEPCGFANILRPNIFGDSDTDFPLNGPTRISKRSLSGTIGSGGRRLALDAVNGSIRVRRAE